MGTTLCCSPINDQWASGQMKVSTTQWIRNQNVNKAKLSHDDRSKVLEKNRYGVIFTCNAYYEGGIQNGKAEGKGFQKIYEHGEYFQFIGQFKQGERVKGKYKRNGSLLFDGEWAHGRPDKGILHLGQNRIQIDQLEIFDETKGKIKLSFEGHFYYEGEFVRKSFFYFTFEGEGRMTFPDQSSYDGGFRNGKFQGMGTYIDGLTKQKYVGRYKEGVKNGRGKYYMDKDRYMEGKWVQGKKENDFYLFQANESNVFEKKEMYIFKNDQMIPIPSFLEQ